MARGCWSGALRGGPSLGASGMRGAACSARSRAVLALHHADGCQRGPWDRDISQTPGTARGRDVPAAKAQQEPALRSPYGCRRPPSSLAPPPRHRKGLPKEPSTQRGQGARDGRGSTGCSCAEGPRQPRGLDRGNAAGAAGPAPAPWAEVESSLLHPPGTSPSGAPVEPVPGVGEPLVTPLRCEPCECCGHRGRS